MNLSTLTVYATFIGVIPYYTGRIGIGELCLAIVPKTPLASTMPSSGLGEPVQVAGMDDILGCLSSMQKMLNADLSKLVPM